MLQKQPFSISLSQGISTKEDPKQLIPGKLILLENGIFTTSNEIRKRDGLTSFQSNILNIYNFDVYSAIPSLLQSGNFLTSFNQELVLNDNINLYSYSSGIAEWVYKGKSSICKLSTMSIVRNTYSQTLPDSAINPAGIQMFAWEDSSTSNVKISIIDTSTGQVIISNQEILPVGVGNTIRPKCAYLNGKLILFYLDTTTNIVMYYLTYAAGVFSSPVTFASNVNTTSAKANYDISVYNNKLYITYNTSDMGGSITVTFLTPALVSGGVITKTAVNADSSITVFADMQSNVWIGYNDGTNLNAFVVDNLVTTTLLNSTLIENVSATLNVTGIGLTNSAIFFYDRKGSADASGYFSNSFIKYNTLTLAGVAGTAHTFLRSAALQSKAFLVTNNGINIPHVVVTHDAALQPTYFLCNLYNTMAVSSVLPRANVVSKIAPSLGGGLPTKQSLSSINLLSSNIFQTALLQKDLLYTSVSTTGTVNSYTQTGVISANFNFNFTNPNTVTLGNNLHIGSSMLGMYDGEFVVEHNFHFYPEALALTINTSGGNLTDSSAYGYQVVYEWTDNKGQLHRSSPSPINSGTTGSHSNASQGSLVIPTLRITGKDNINIVVYRTQANGTTYYRLNLPTTPLANSLINNTVTYTDNASDTSIAANEQLYTTGGEVPNISAPASTILGTYKNRIILIPSENPFSWWYSKQVIPGSPVEFSDLFIENIGTIDGPITTVSQLDSNLLFFKENTIYYVSGDGPTPAGTNNDFTQALKIVSDVGCINSQSIVLMPDGVVFKSHKGIYLLDRSLQVHYIGSEVEEFNSNEITSAQLIVNTNQLKFTLDNRTVLMYDYFAKQWSVFTNHNGISSTITDNLYTFLQSDGLVLQETPNSFNDNGSFIKLKLITSWLSLAGIQGFQRIYKALILGQYFGPHKLLCQIAYDFNPIFTQQNFINASTLLNSNIYGFDPVFAINSPYAGSYPLYQWRIFTTRQLCESIQISLEDIPIIGNIVNEQGVTIQTTYNQGLSLSNISLECGIKKGLNKMASNRSFGS